jgi:hypothetical protein
MRISEPEVVEKFRSGGESGGKWIRIREPDT